MDRVAEARAAHARGWSLTPLAGKVPLLTGWPTLPPLTMPEVEEWASKSNMGIRTGAASGVFIIDLEAGADRSLLGDLPPCPEVRTGRGGTHLYFAHPGNLGNSAGKLGPKIDTRGDGGQAVYPGSVTEAPYVWVVRPEDCPLPPVPAHLLERLRPKPRAKPAPKPLPPSTAYAKAAIEGLLAEVAAAPEGTRNDTLNRAAFRAGQLHGAGEIPDIRDALAGASTDPDTRKVVDTVSRGWEAGVREPRPRQPKSDGARASRTAQEAPEPDGGPDTPSPNQATPERFTDLGNARRLVRTNGADLRHTGPRGWFVWDGTRWAPDDTGEATRRAKVAIESMVAEAKTEIAMKHAFKSQSAGAINACLALASTEPTVAVRQDEFDAHPGLLNTPSGVVELSTGTLHPHDRGLMLTRCTVAAYREDATCSRWDAFLEQILPDPEVRAYVQRYAGYSLHGSKTAQCFAFLYGTGANGKSTFLDTLCAALGDYATSTPFDTFLQRQAGQASNDLARLAGARLVRSSEPDEGAVLSESVVKTATGGEPITARFLHKEFFEFQPEFALWLSGNHQPRVRGTDHGIWRRIHLVPFTVRVETPNPNLKDELAVELDGILAWAVRGHAEFKRLGLAPPRAVVEATAEYRKEQDALGQFFDDACTLGVEQACYSSDLRSAYTDWCKTNDEHALSARRFAGALKERGCVATRDSWGQRRWRGIAPKAKQEA